MAWREQYFDKQNKPIMSESYCVYADILGTENDVCVAQTRGESELNHLLQRFCEAWRTANRALGDSPESIVPDQPVWVADVFSDCVILAGPVVIEECEFEGIVPRIARWQLRLAINGFFVRGGFAMGELHVSKDIMFGPALVEAASMERTLAVHPRIVLSRKTLRRLDEAGGRDRESVQEQGGHPGKSIYENFVSRDPDDTQRFIDYLLCTHTENGVKWEQIELHGKRIQERLETHAKQPVVYRKYKWLANYHNRFCETLRKRTGFCDSYLVKCSDL